jgi:hypothetical protein
MSVAVRLATNKKKPVDKVLLPFYCQNTLVALLVILVIFVILVMQVM